VVNGTTSMPRRYTSRPVNGSSSVQIESSQDAWGTTHLIANDLFTAPFIDEDTTGTDTKRDIVRTGSWPTTTELTDIALVEACAWSGCAAAQGNLSLAPSFADEVTGDFHLADDSVLRSAGEDPESAYAGPFADYELDGQLRPQGMWDIGLDERL